MLCRLFRKVERHYGERVKPDPSAVSQAEAQTYGLTCDVPGFTISNPDIRVDGSIVSVLGTLIPTDGTDATPQNYERYFRLPQDVRDDFIETQPTENGLKIYVRAIA